MSFWTYMLRCSDGAYYVGHTDDLEKRIDEHELGAIARFGRKPLQLVKKPSPRNSRLSAGEKKEALIRQDWTALKRASKKNFPKRKA